MKVHTTFSSNLIFFVLRLSVGQIDSVLTSAYVYTAKSFAGYRPTISSSNHRSQCEAQICVPASASGVMKVQKEMDLRRPILWSQ